MSENYKFQRRIFAEICEGFSRARFKGEPIYIKHFNQFDCIVIDFEYERLLSMAKERGLQTQEEKIVTLKDSGGIDIAALDSDIENLFERIKDEKASKSKQHLQTVARRIQDKIDALTRDYNRLSEERSRFLSDTCEHVADKESNYYSIKNSIFKDSELKTPLWNDEDFDDVDGKDIYEVSMVHSESVGRITENEIKKLALSDLVMNYWRVAEKSAYALFGVPVKNLTSIQTSLCIHLQVFSAILENSKNIPADSRYDPDKLLEFYNIKSNSEGIVKNDADGVAVVGATKEDYAAMGHNETNSVFADDLVRKATEGKTNADGTKKKVLEFDEIRKIFGNN